MFTVGDSIVIGMVICFAVWLLKRKWPKVFSDDWESWLGERLVDAEARAKERKARKEYKRTPKLWGASTAQPLKPEELDPNMEKLGAVLCPYGYCPICGAKGIQRERRPDGNDKCANGHTYPSREARQLEFHKGGPVVGRHNQKQDGPFAGSLTDKTREELEELATSQGDAAAALALQEIARRDIDKAFADPEVIPDGPRGAEDRKAGAAHAGPYKPQGFA